MLDEERGHLTWVKKWLDKEALVRPTVVREVMRRYAADAHAYVAMNRYYADYMVAYMGLEPNRVHVIPHGLHLDGHGTRQREPGESSFTIGYFARICPEKGFHLAIEASRRAGIPFGIAGRVLPNDAHLRYFADEIRPHLGRAADAGGRRRAARDAQRLRLARQCVLAKGGVEGRGRSKR